MCGEDATATVHRVGSRLQIRVDVAAGTEPRLVEAAAVRAEGAVRNVDPWADQIDVSVGER